jgi:protein TonB
MITRRLMTLLGSAALHAAAIAGALCIVTALRQPEPLFVDLTGGVQAGDESAAAAAPPQRREPSVRPARQAPVTSARTSHAPAEPAPAAPAPPAESAPRAEPTPAPAPSLSGSLETAASSPTAPLAAAAADGGRAGGVASDAVAHAGQPAGAVGGGGSLLALAGPGTGRGGVPPELGPYLARFRQRVQDLVLYPLAARRRGLSGRVEVELVLEPSGRVRDIAVATSSSHALLDDAAVEAVRALEPMPMPEHLPRRPLRVRLPVIFQLQ